MIEIGRRKLKEQDYSNNPAQEAVVKRAFQEPFVGKLFRAGDKRLEGGDITVQLGTHWP